MSDTIVRDAVEGEELTLEAMTPEAVAERVLRDAHVTSYPVNPLEIAAALSIPVFWTSFDDAGTLGSASIENGGRRIDVRADDPPNRRRFTVAHEIGHMLLHLSGARRGLFDDDMDSTNPQKEWRTVGFTTSKEAEANRFAAALLMPDNWVREAFDADPSISNLSAKFNVSTDAMEVRLRVLKLT